MTTPKPPSPRSVSATLRTADFRAWTEERGEGYGVAWWDEDRTTVYVSFTADYGDDSMEAVEAASRLLATAMAGMASVLLRKGWQVEECGSLAPHLLVTLAHHRCQGG